MIEALLVIVLGVPAYAFWSAGRSAAETAVELGRRACAQAGVQWLDQSAHQVRLRLRRDRDGRLRWERQFRFEYSALGEDRHAGLITLLGDELQSLVGPVAAEPRLH